MIRHFRFPGAVAVSIIIHIVLVLIILSSIVPKKNVEKKDVKYVKVKIGAIEQPPKTTQNQKAKAKQSQKINPPIKPTPKKPEPKMEPKPVPVVPKNIEIPKPKPAMSPATLPQPVAIKKQEALPVKTLPDRTEKKIKNAQTDRNAHYVRGSKLGNRKKTQQEIIKNYKQRIVLWLGKHQVYPEEAQRRQLTGLAKMSLTIRRDGKLLSYILKESTGYAILDQAVREMIEHSDPFPAFPEDYEDIEYDTFDLNAEIIIEKPGY